jgi:hypothetical protein
MIITYSEKLFSQTFITILLICQGGHGSNTHAVKTFLRWPILHSDSTLSFYTFSSFRRRVVFTSVIRRSFVLHSIGASQKVRDCEILEME